MKGVIFNVVQEVIEDLYDPDTWDDLLDAVALDGAYTALGDYADEELTALVAAAATATGLPPDEVLRVVGRHALPRLVARVPASLPLARDARSFIRQVNDIIHPEVLKLYPSSNPPAFTFEDEDGALLVRYSSVRNLPALAEGLLIGVDDMFEEGVVVHRVEELEADGTALFRVSVDSR